MSIPISTSTTGKAVSRRLPAHNSLFWEGECRSPIAASEAGIPFGAARAMELYRRQSSAESLLAKARVPHLRVRPFGSQVDGRAGGQPLRERSASTAAGHEVPLMPPQYVKAYAIPWWASTPRIPGTGSRTVAREDRDPRAVPPARDRPLGLMGAEQGDEHRREHSRRDYAANIGAQRVRQDDLLGVDR